MTSSPGPDEAKPPRGKRFRGPDPNSRDENTQRHGRPVHMEYVAIPVLPIVVITLPDVSSLTEWLVSAGLAGLTLLGRLARNYVTSTPRIA